MDALIDENGALWVRRGEEYKEQRCRFNATEGRPCSDSCPLFGEPQQDVSETDWFMVICQDRMLNFNSVKDSRQK